MSNPGAQIPTVLTEEARYLYEKYKEYAWREYDLLEKRAQWVYLANSLLFAALVYVLQQTVSTLTQPNPKSLPPGFVHILMIGIQIAIGLVPLTAIIFNALLVKEMINAARAIESIRVKWREFRSKALIDSLPQVSYGFQDMGQETRGIVLSSILPGSLILFWIGVSIFGEILLQRAF